MTIELILMIHLPPPTHTHTHTHTRAHADVAEIVLNRCTVEKESNKKQQSREGKNYEVLFNYEFIEDYNGYIHKLNFLH